MQELLRRGFQPFRRQSDKQVQTNVEERVIIVGYSRTLHMKLYRMGDCEEHVLCVLMHMNQRFKQR